MKTAWLPVLLLMLVSVGVAKMFGMALHQKDPVGDLKSWEGKPLAAFENAIGEQSWMKYSIGTGPSVVRNQMNVALYKKYSLALDDDDNIKEVRRRDP